MMIAFGYVLSDKFGKNERFSEAGAENAEGGA